MAIPEWLSNATKPALLFRESKAEVLHTDNVRLAAGLLAVAGLSDPAWT